MDEHRKTRRRHSVEFKSQVVEACRTPGVSVAGVALTFGVNANLARQWMHGRGFAQAARGAAKAAPQSKAAATEFVPVALPAALTTPQAEAAAAASDIRIEVRRGGMQISVSWPQSSAADCGAWLRELLR